MRDGFTGSSCKFEYVHLVRILEQSDITVIAIPPSGRSNPEMGSSLFVDRHSRPAGAELLRDDNHAYSANPKICES